MLITPETGQAGKNVPDHEILAFAASPGMAVVTMNRRHFVGLSEENPNHSGVIVCTIDLDSPALAARIHQAIHASASLNGRLIRRSRPPR